MWSWGWAIALLASSMLLATATHNTSLPINSTTKACTSPEYHPASTFSFPATTTRFATSNTPRPVTTYALPYRSVETHFANISSTTWPNWTPTLVPSPPNSTAAATMAQYDTAAFTALWDAASPTNFTRGIYSATVSPSPVPSSELALPPPMFYKPDTHYKFPKDFIYGAAGAAGQCEGAVADHGKSPSVLDMIANLLSLAGGLGGSVGAILGGTGAKIVGNYVANEHYYLYKQDIERLASMGMKHYGLSIPWTRILPFALPGTPVNSEAIQHYDEVINFVLSKGMQPMVTLHHFDTPLQFFGGGKEYVLQYVEGTGNYGAGSNFGFQNETFEDAFVHFAQIVMSHYADRVPTWITVNEPQVGSPNGVAVNTVVKSHARIVHFYREVLNGTGKVSMKMSGNPAVPTDPSNQTNIAAAQFYTDIYISPFLYPLGSGRDYPEAYKQVVPDFVPLSEADLAYLNGTMDFVALDAYAAPVVAPAVSNLTACGLDHNSTTNPAYRYPICLELSMATPTNWSLGYSPTGSFIFYDSPFNLRTQLQYTWYEYKLPILISEFQLGVPAPPGGRIEDNLYNVPASQYNLAYLTEVLRAIWEDGIDVIGAVSWNWGDDWEFGSLDTGIGSLQFVNHTTQERRFRRSFFDAIEFVEGNRQC